jgi:hypothetical protein
MKCVLYVFVSSKCIYIINLLMAKMSHFELWSEVWKTMFSKISQRIQCYNTVENKRTGKCCYCVIEDTIHASLADAILPANRFVIKIILYENTSSGGVNELAMT